ncbi:MAG: ferrous iron transporter B [Candidatus Thermoplasmatota archaeon]|nr:ferrous iron transporter B [Candidatus Thermoplasmatota archaeon]MBS3789425.1 ferrous iron transporter B [Candidatus Thermoplasmatota archaeon]
MECEIDERWKLVDRIAEETVTYGDGKTTLKDAIAELTVKPLTGLPIALAVLYGFWSFFSAFAGFFTDGFFVRLFDNHWLPWLQGVFPGKGSWYYFILVGDPAAGNSFEAFGMLTSGLFVAIGIVLPAITAFYLYLIILEDSGYMPRLAVLIDTLLHKIGLHGFAIVPMILSLGCNVPGVAATRTLQTKKQRFMMITLLAIFIPCGAQLGVIFSLIPEFAGIILLYLLIGFIFFGFILHKVIPGKSPEILIDIPPYRTPSLENVSKKLWVRTKGFFTTAIPFVLLGVGLVNVLYLGGVIDWLAEALGPLLTTWFGVPKETVGPLVAGFLRKDLAVAQLSAIEMTKYQLISSVVLVNLYFPCIATFIMMMKEGSERGVRGVLEILGGSLLVLATVLFIWGGLLHLIWIMMGVA